MSARLRLAFWTWVDQRYTHFMRWVYFSAVYKVTDAVHRFQRYVKRQIAAAEVAERTEAVHAARSR